MKADVKRDLYATGARRKLGWGNGFGFIRFADAKFGDSNRSAGIYQRRVTGYNQTGRIAGRPRKGYYVKMRKYRPTNPQTTAQQAQRQKMTDAIISWQGLTNEQQSEYNKRAIKQGRAGYLLYRSEYLKSH